MSDVIIYSIILLNNDQYNTSIFVIFYVVYNNYYFVGKLDMNRKQNMQFAREIFLRLNQFQAANKLY